MSTCICCGAAIHNRRNADQIVCRDVLIGYVCSTACLDRLEMSLTPLREAVRGVLGA